MANAASHRTDASVPVRGRSAGAMQSLLKLTMVKPVQLRKSDAGAVAASLASQWTPRLRELTMVKLVQLRKSDAGAIAASPPSQRTMQSLLKPMVLLW